MRIQDLFDNVNSNETDIRKLTDPINLQQQMRQQRPQKLFNQPNEEEQNSDNNRSIEIQQDPDESQQYLRIKRQFVEQKEESNVEESKGYEKEEQYEEGQEDLPIQFIQKNFSYYSQKQTDYQYLQQRAEITQKQFKILKSKEAFLNDNIVMSYLYYCAKHLCPDVYKDSIYIFDSLFFSRLVEEPNLIENVLQARKFSKRIQNLFDYKFWIIPICLKKHWSMLIVFNAIELFEMEDTNQVNNLSQKYGPCLLVLDSLRNQNQLGFRKYEEDKKMIIKFIEYEYIVRKIKGGNDDIDLRIALANSEAMLNMNTYERQLKLQIFYANCPRQNNSYDCGVYLLQYAELFIQQPEALLEIVIDQNFIEQHNDEEDDDFYRQKDNVWFDARFIRQKRQNIAKIFYMISKGQDPEQDYKIYRKLLIQYYCNLAIQVQ